MTRSALAPLDLSEEVADAFAAREPVVALESTIISHGLPFPRNIEIAREIEAAVRAGGAVPATIAVLNGRIRVGLGAGELEAFAEARGVMKLSRADLAFAVSSGRPGATTVAATMIVAALAGIRVFATGGIGGVHRGAEASFDISADLEELARTDVVVVSAGAKALLDLPKTLEVLETRGVPVVGWGTDIFPAFWSRSSGLALSLRVDSAAALVSFAAARRALGVRGGILVANPVPQSDEISADEIEAAIVAAHYDAVVNGIKGKAVTPFLLDRIFALTSGRSLVTNRSLVLNNATVGAEIAAAFASEAKVQTI
jgi:pseudouridine-5'-phosphate glycosidase